MTHADETPLTFALVEPALVEIAHVLERHDQQIATIAATHLALTLLRTLTGTQPTPAVRRAFDVLDETLAALYDGYEASLARQVRQ